uniref:Zinc phosphodiesterase ELAC protein 2 n=1 Tax=Cacopsylla melanoneura TaxID=428564 RepID=A0A8D8W545_9HEMI
MLLTKLLSPAKTFHSISQVLCNTCNMSGGTKVMQHAQNLKFQRVKLREKNMKYVPGIINLQVLGSGAYGAPKSLYLFTDQSRYLFNCGEGTQRLAHEHKMRLAKLDSIFITQPTWDNLGGLPGLALTIQDVGVPEITLHGPDGLEQIFVGTRRFVVLKNLSVITKECVAYDKYEDHIISVTYVPLVSSQDSSNGPTDTSSGSPPPTDDSEDDIDYYDYETNQSQTVSQANKKRRHHSPPSSRNDSSPTKRPTPSSPASTTMTYICQLKPRPGALSLDKCVAHNVPPGPLLGKLKAGQDVTLADGTVVRSADVTEPDEIGPVFIVLDCPDESYLDSLLKESIFARYQESAASPDDIAVLVAHFSPPHVLSHPRYKEFMSKFPSSTQHLILNESNHCLGSVAVHKIQCKLNVLNKHIFPMLCDNGIPVIDKESPIPPTPAPTTPTESSTDPPPPSVPLSPSLQSLMTDLVTDLASHYSGLDSNSVLPSSSEPTLIQARTLMKIPLRPRLPLDTSPPLSLDIPAYVRETLTSSPEFPDALSALKQSLEQEEQTPHTNNNGNNNSNSNSNVDNDRETVPSEDRRKFPEVTFLGTGSSIPNKTRNTSSILLRIDPSSCMLLDCGEGTLSQLVRLFGPRQLDDILSQLGAIYISHLHADHHLGLISLIQARARVRSSSPTRKLVLLAPKQIITWLNLYSARFQRIGHLYTLVPLSLFENHGQNRPPLDQDTISLLSSLGLSSLTTCLVHHCPNAFGVALTTLSGHKITYSGDTMPCDGLVSIGKNSDLLIHEATHEDELEREARLKMHSTVSQAIRIGRDMFAKHVLLTHFSQRYAKLPRLNRDLNENVGIAFDNMRISLSDLPKLKHFYPALKLMFAEYQDEIEVRAMKRNLKAEVKRNQKADVKRKLSIESAEGKR